MSSSAIYIGLDERVAECAAEVVRKASEGEFLESSVESRMRIMQDALG